MFASLAVGLIIIIIIIIIIVVIIIIIIISDQKENFSFGDHPTKHLPQLPSSPVPQMSNTVVTYTRLSKPESIKKLNSPPTHNNDQSMNESIDLDQSIFKSSNEPLVFWLMNIMLSWNRYPVVISDSVGNLMKFSDSTFSGNSSDLELPEPAVHLNQEVSDSVFHDKSINYL